RGGSPRPVKPPRAGVDLEVAAGPAPPADHGTARGIEHELHDPVVHGAPVVARRRRALGPTARDEQAVGGQVELERARLRRPARADEPAAHRAQLDPAPAPPLGPPPGADGDVRSVQLPVTSRPSVDRSSSSVPVSVGPLVPTSRPPTARSSTRCTPSSSAPRPVLTYV